MLKRAQRDGPLGQVIEFPTARIRPRVDASSVARERALLERAKGGDPTAMRELYRLHASDFLGFLRRLCGNTADAEDIAQEAFITTFDRVRRVQSGRFRSFLYAVGVRKCHHLFRKRRLLARLGFRGADPEIADVARPGASPEDLAELAEVLRFVARLPADQRLAWVLRRFEGYTNDEAAALCGCSVATVKRRVRAADDALAEKLKEYGRADR